MPALSWGLANGSSVAGAAADFAYPLKTLDGRTIPDLSTWGVRTVVIWQLLWVAIGAFLAALVDTTSHAHSPLPRGGGRQNRQDDNASDVIVGAVVLVATVTIVIGGVSWAEAEYPRSVPLQAGKCEPTRCRCRMVKSQSRFVQATYDVPGRSMKLTLLVKNETPDVLEIGEFSSANVRFINAKSENALAQR